AAQIQMKLTPQAHVSMQHLRTVNPRAYESYLEGTYFRTRGTTQGLNGSLELFAQAINLDPAYAQAHAGLAHSWYVLGIRGLRPPGEAFPKAEAAALKALELDDTVVEAHTSLAEVKKGYDWNWSAAEAHYRRAIELSQSYSLAHA